ncbi:hypothetical protein [Actinomadura macrotermitis]|uniref:Uncharacterized protein n=1 Tax=Actinomadura macrotermitis TaxID=2585200 RepID=A0A7K0BMR2_9ACTN|nr:hypothetical protein [Actinomadura macrotermitis]MQY02467.1 hypothetical protein [Actinomadura macrotermitis]
MTDQQPGDVLDEAAKLFDVLRRKVAGAAGRGPAGGGDDVWGAVLTEDPHIATGAPECRNCPVCRAIALARESGPDVGRHARDAARSLMAAGLDVVAAFERTRGGTRRPGPGASRPAPGPAARRDQGGPWASATGGDPIDIG